MSQLDKTILTFGVHKGKAVKDIPSSYFLWMAREFNEPKKRWVRLAIDTLIERGVLGETSSPIEFKVIKAVDRAAPVGTIITVSRAALGLSSGLLPVEGDDAPGIKSSGSHLVDLKTPLPGMENVAANVAAQMENVGVGFVALSGIPSHDDIEKVLEDAGYPSVTHEDLTGTPARIAVATLREKALQGAVPVLPQVLVEITTLYNSDVVFGGQSGYWPPEATFEVFGREAALFGKLQKCETFVNHTSVDHHWRGSMRVVLKYLNGFWEYRLHPSRGVTLMRVT